MSVLSLHVRTSPIKDLDRHANLVAATDPCEN